MYIGSLTGKTSPVDCRYSYFFRGTSFPLKPDLSKEEYDLDVYEKENGKLLIGGPVGWKTDTLLDVGVDIVFKLEKECFIDHIVLNQETESSFKKIEIIKLTDSGEQIISVYSAQTGKNVTDEEIKKLSFS